MRKTLILCTVLLFLVGCAGQMLQGRAYNTLTGNTLSFAIEKSYGHGTMTAFNPKNNEAFKGEYSGFYKGQNTIYGNIGGDNVTLIQPPTGANANGILVGDKGTTIRVFFEIKPGLRPTGYGIGQDQAGNKYDFYF